jgi:hypothetical protein
LSFSARSWAAVFVRGDGGEAALPCPENVALEGGPKIDGCGAGAARQASAVVHAGGAFASLGQSLEPEQTCAS